MRITIEITCDMTALSPTSGGFGTYGIPLKGNMTYGSSGAYGAKIYEFLI